MDVVDGYESWMNIPGLPTDVVVPAKYWGGNNHWMFDPWAKREGALNIHNHRHTAWAQHIFDNWAFMYDRISPANFDWRGETIFIVGRGESLSQSAPALNSAAREGRCLWLNSACCHPGVEMKPQDYVMAFDAAISTDVAMKGAAKGRKFITAPIMAAEVVKWPWANVFGFTLWNDAPMNGFMRNLFPDLPELVECLGVNVSALHLAALSGAKKIVLVAQDCVSDTDIGNQGMITHNMPSGTVQSDIYYSQLAMAVSMLSFFAFKHTGVEIVNCSGTALIGHDLLSKNCSPFPWMKCDKLENHI